MLCYKDMCYCSYYKECKRGNKCFRALTQEVECDADSKDLRISQFAEKPDCFKEIKSKKGVNKK